MVRKRYSKVDAVRLLHEIEQLLSRGAVVASACYSVGVSDTAYYNWRKKYAGLMPSEMERLRELE